MLSNLPRNIAGDVSLGYHSAVTSICVSGVQLALAEAQSQLPHTARAGVTGILADAELPQDPTAAHTGAAQRRTIEDLLVTTLLLLS